MARAIHRLNNWSWDNVRFSSPGFSRSILATNRKIAFRAEREIRRCNWLLNYRRENNSGAFCSSCKKSVSCLSMLDTRLRSLKGKPMDGVVGTKPLASCYNTGLETRGGDVFHPNKHRVMGMRRVAMVGVAMVIHWCKNANRCSRVWKTSTKGRVLTLVSFIANKLHFSLSLLGPWKSKSNNNDKLLWSFSAPFILFYFVCLFVLFNSLSVSYTHLTLPTKLEV